MCQRYELWLEFKESWKFGKVQAFYFKINAINLWQSTNYEFKIYDLYNLIVTSNTGVWFKPCGNKIWNLPFIPNSINFSTLLDNSIVNYTCMILMILSIISTNYCNSVFVYVRGPNVANMKTNIAMLLVIQGVC